MHEEHEPHRSFQSSRRRWPSMLSAWPSTCRSITSCRSSPTINVCGPRVSELETAQVGDLAVSTAAQSASAGPSRRTTATATWTFPTTCSPRRGRRSPPVKTATWKRRSLPELDEAALRTAITRRLQGHRHPALLPAWPAPPPRLAALQAHRFARRRGREPPGDSKRVAAEHYVYALTDYREADRSIALRRARK